MNKAKMKKIGSIVLNVLLYAFLAICIFAVFVTVFAKREADGAAEIFGYQMRVVTSDSMAKCELTDVSEYEIKDIPVRSMVFVEVMPDDPTEADQWYSDLKVGDVLTFRYVYTTQVTITHRITAITEKEDGGFIFQLAGDNKNSEDGVLYQEIDTSIPNNTNYVIGKVVGQAKILGMIVSALMQPVGIVLVIIVPCIIIITIEVIKIAKVFMDDKRSRELEDKENKEKELEELKRRLAELEKEKMAQEEAPKHEQSEKTDNEGGDA